MLSIILVYKVALLDSPLATALQLELLVSISVYFYLFCRLLLNQCHGMRPRGKPMTLVIQAPARDTEDVVVVPDPR